MSAYNLDKPWERQPFEGDLEWALFQEYLALPAPRSVRTLARQGGPLSWSQLETLALDHGWFARARLWDAHLDKLRQDTIEREVQEDARAVAKRHARVARKAIALGERELDKLLSSAERSDMPGLISPRDVARLVFIGSKLERLVIGEAETIQEHRVNLDALTVEELRQLRELQAKAGIE